MEIITLTKDQFDKFSENHPLHTFYQSSMYGNLMKSKGFDIHFYGFQENNILVGASLILIKKLFLKNNFAYAPRGFLIDYNNKSLLAKISEELKIFLGKKNVVFLKIDPPVINNKRDEDGKILVSQYKTDLIPYFQKIGYHYFGDNKFFGTLKPRWHAILKVTGTSKTLFNNLDPNVKNKIRKAQSRGIEIIQGHSENDIDIFYKFIQKKQNKSLDYYQSLSTFFGDKFELYFSKLNTEQYLKNIKKLYEKELETNNEINEKIQIAGQQQKITEKLTNIKINSDKLLATYKAELERSSNLFESNPQGIIISAGAYMITKYGVYLLIEGQSPKYHLFYPMFYNKWYMIEKYSKIGAIYFDLNAITGNFTNSNKFKGLNEMKLGYNADVYEYIGEFDLIIKKTLYKIYQKIGLGKKQVKKQNKIKMK